MLPLGLINASTVHWQGPPDDLVSNVLKFSANIFTFHLDKIHIKKGFLSGIQIFEVNKEWRLRIFSKMFENFAQGIVSDKEETHVDPDKHTYYFLNDKNVLVSKRPGRTTMNFDYKIGFGTSNQDSEYRISQLFYKFNEFSYS